MPSDKHVYLHVCAPVFCAPEGVLAYVLVRASTKKFVKGDKQWDIKNLWEATIQFGMFAYQLSKQGGDGQVVPFALQMKPWCVCVYV